jgi:Toastrack DUF4097
VSAIAASGPTEAPSRTWLKVIGGVVAVALVLGGAYRLLAFLARDTFTVHTAYAGVRVLYVDDKHGNVNVIPEPAGSPLRVNERVTRSFIPARRHVAREAGGVLRLRASCEDLIGADCSVRYTIFAPPEVSLLLSAAQGNVTVHNVVSQTPLTLNAAAGSVIVDGLTAPRIDLSSAAGDVRASGLRSPVVSASSAAGDVRLTMAVVPRSLSAESTAGNVHLTLPDAIYSVDAQTVAGERPSVDLREDPRSPNRITAKSTAGGVRIDRAVK